MQPTDNSVDNTPVVDPHVTAANAPAGAQQTSHTMTVRNNPAFAKYFRMLQLVRTLFAFSIIDNILKGIPMGGVKQKFQGDGYDPALLEFVHLNVFENNRVLIAAHQMRRVTIDNTLQRRRTRATPIAVRLIDLYHFTYQLSILVF